LNVAGGAVGLKLQRHEEVARPEIALHDVVLGADRNDEFVVVQPVEHRVGVVRPENHRVEGADVLA